MPPSHNTTQHTTCNSPIYGNCRKSTPSLFLSLPVCCVLCVVMTAFCVLLRPNIKASTSMLGVEILWLVNKTHNPWKGDLVVLVLDYFIFKAFEVCSFFPLLYSTLSTAWRKRLNEIPNAWIWPNLEGKRYLLQSHVFPEAVRFFLLWTSSRHNSPKTKRIFTCQASREKGGKRMGMENQRQKRLGL